MDYRFHNYVGVGRIEKDEFFISIIFVLGIQRCLQARVEQHVADVDKDTEIYKVKILAPFSANSNQLFCLYRMLNALKLLSARIHQL